MQQMRGAARVLAKGENASPERGGARRGEGDSLGALGR